MEAKHFSKTSGQTCYPTGCNN